MRAFAVVPLAAALAGACAAAPPTPAPSAASTASSTPAGERSSNPCITFTPESFSAGWSLPEDRRCSSASDCTEVIVKFENLDCKSGFMGGFASALASHVAEATVRGRLSRVEPCELGEKMHVRSMCKAPPLECANGLCAYKDAPPRLGL